MVQDRTKVTMMD